MATVEVGNLEALWLQKFNTLRGIAQSIAAERARGNESGVRALVPYFNSVATELREINERIGGAELTWVDRFLLQVDSGVRTIAGIPAAALDMSGLKPLLVLGLVAVVLTQTRALFRGDR